MPGNIWSACLDDTHVGRYLIHIQFPQMKEAWNPFWSYWIACVFALFTCAHHCAPEEATTKHLVSIRPNRCHSVSPGASFYRWISELMMSWLLAGMVLIFLLFFFTSYVITLRSSSVISCNMWRSCYSFLFCFLFLPAKLLDAAVLSVTEPNHPLESGSLGALK